MILCSPAQDVAFQKLLFSTVSLQSTGGDQLNPFDRQGGRLPKGYKVSSYLSSPDAFFAITDAPGGVYQAREDMRLMEDTNKNNLNMTILSYFRCKVGVYDHRWIYGDPGV